MAATPDYKRIYKKFHSSPEAKKQRAERNRARNEAKAKWLVRKWDGKDVDHVNWIHSKKTRVISASANRSRPQASRIKWSTRNKKNWGK